MADSNNDQALKWYSTREPIILLVLSTLAVVFFLVVSGFSRIYHTQQESLGESWFRRATADQQAGNLDRAISEFQVAELYSRDNFLYRLSLAQTLAARGRTDEAYSYLLNLREQQPDDGTVNLELARILTKKGDTNQALRYYHNALYAAWATDPEEHRRAVRLELISFLLAEDAKTQAQSELIALAANLPTDVGAHTRVAKLFAETQDYEHALAEYREALKIDRHNSASLAGAGRAAYELTRYASARRYLQAALATDPSDSASAGLLNTVTLVLDMDPYRRQISVSQRSQAVVDAFGTAGERLKKCPLGTTRAASSTTTPQLSLEDRWKEMKPRVSEPRLRRNPDLVDAAMDLVFTIEQETTTTCGAPAGKDLALLLVSKLHEGSER